MSGVVDVPDREWHRGNVGPEAWTTRDAFTSNHDELHNGHPTLPRDTADEHQNPARFDEELKA